jgi:hypothetical protein
MPVELEYLHCPICQQVSLVETPPCPDGHGADCPERLCTACGYVLSIAPTPSRARARRRVA